MKGTLATEADLIKERRVIRIKFSFVFWDDLVFAYLPNLSKAQVGHFLFGADLRQALGLA